MDVIIAQLDAAVLASMLAVVMAAAWGIGWWLGQNWRSRYSDASASQWYTAVLPLVSLLLAFTVNTSIGMHNERQRMVVSDSNAIYDLYTCAGMLDEPVKSKLQNLIGEYAKLRIDLSQLLDQGPMFDSVLRRSDQLMTQMYELVAPLVKNGTPLASALTNALDRVADSQTARLAAVRNRLPPSIVLLLMSSAVLATLLLGSREGSSGRIHVLGAVGFIFLVSFTIYVTLDLNQPTQGRITVNQGPIEQLFSSMPN